MYEKPSSGLLGGGGPFPKGARQAPLESDVDTFSYATIAILQAWRKELEETFERGLKSQAVQLKEMEEKCDQSELTKEVASLTKELDEERGERRATLVTLMETIGKLKDDIQELNARTTLLAERMEEMGAGRDSHSRFRNRPLEAEEPVPCSSSSVRPRLNLESECEGDGEMQGQDSCPAPPQIKIERVERSMVVENEDFDINPPTALLHAVLPTTQSGRSQDYDYSHHLYLVDRVPENEGGSQTPNLQLTPMQNVMRRHNAGRGRLPLSKRFCLRKSESTKQKLESSRLYKNKSKNTPRLKSSGIEGGKSTENRGTSSVRNKRQPLLKSSKSIEPGLMRITRSTFSTRRDGSVNKGLSLGLPVLPKRKRRPRSSIVKTISTDKNGGTVTTAPIAVNVGSNSKVLDGSVRQNLAVIATKETVSEFITPAVKDNTTSKQPDEVIISATSSNRPDSNVEFEMIWEHSQKASTSTANPRRNEEIVTQGFMESSKRRQTSSQSATNPESFRFGSKKQIKTSELSTRDHVSVSASSSTVTVKPRRAAIVIATQSFMEGPQKTRSHCFQSAASIESLGYESMRPIIPAESSTRTGKR